MEKNIWKFVENVDLKGYSLIIPCVAVGNVSQLVCDLLVSSLDMNKIASIYSPALIPVLGHDPYNLSSNNLSGSCEIYKSDVQKIVVMQIRAPLVYKYAAMFILDIIQKFKEYNLNDIVVLTSSSAHEKKHIQTSAFRYIVSETYSHRKKIETLNWTAHEFLDSRVRIPGGGCASMLYEALKQAAIPFMILYKFCSEGDNIPDSYEMIEQLASVVPIFNEKSDLKSQLKQPVSWKMLFGSPPPVDIY